MSRCRLSRHAQARRKQMRVSEDRIDSVLAEPELSYCSHDERTCYVADGLVVVVENDSGTVVTLLWHRATGRDHPNQDLVRKVDDPDDGR